MQAVAAAQAKAMKSADSRSNALSCPFPSKAANGFEMSQAHHVMTPMQATMLGSQQ